jgi:hypothetical protein
VKNVLCVFNQPLTSENIKNFSNIFNNIFNFSDSFINSTRSPQSGVLYIFKDRHFNIKKCVNNSKQVKVKSE